MAPRHRRVTKELGDESDAPCLLMNYNIIGDIIYADKRRVNSLSHLLFIDNIQIINVLSMDG